MKMKDFNICKFKFNIEKDDRRSFYEYGYSEEDIRRIIIQNCKYILKHKHKLNFIHNSSYKNISVSINNKQKRIDVGFDDRIPPFLI